MITKPTPAVSVAINYVKTRIDNGAWKPGERLPGIRTLCKMAGVSLVTMWKAVDFLKNDGLLTVIHGQGMRVASAGDGSGEGATEFLQPVPRGRKWDALRLQLQRDIVDGVYVPGQAMPSIKEMAIRYGVSFQTLKRALDVLVKEEAIVPFKRTYKVPALVGRRAGASVVVLARGDRSGDVSSWTPWSEEYLRFLERECTKLKVNFDYVVYAQENGKMTFTKKDGEPIRDLNFSDLTIGFLVRSVSPDDSYLEALRKIAPLGRPIAISDEGACPALPAAFAGDPRVKVFALATSAIAGQLVGRYLLQLGHRRVAYISPFHKALWCRNRCTGLVDTFRQAGIPDGVSEFTIDEFPFPLGFKRSVPIDEKLVARIAEAALQHHDRELARNVTNKVEAAIAKAVDEEDLRGYLIPLFDKALADRAISAWVAVNDRIAMLAMDYLKARGRLKDVSLVSFDDTFEAYNNELSSYNFNITALAQAMLSWVLCPEQSGRIHPGKVVNIHGMVVHRKSARKVGKD